jgi:hypothetical protein
VKEETVTVYLVRGASGEYSDRSEWTVCAFNEKRQAERFVTQIETELRRIGTDRDIFRLSCGARGELERQLQKIDPSAHVDYTGLRYWVEPVDIRAELPVIALDVQAIWDAGVNE